MGRRTLAAPTALRDRSPGRDSSSCSPTAPTAPPRRPRPGPSPRRSGWRDGRARPDRHARPRAHARPGEAWVLRPDAHVAAVVPVTAARRRAPPRPRSSLGRRATVPYYRRCGDIPPEAPHPAPPTRRRPLLRGADGRGGLLLRLLAALPPRAARRRSSTPRPWELPDQATAREPPAAAAAPQAARPLPRRGLEGARRRDRPPAGAGQRRRADLLRRRRRGRARSTATRSATSASTSSRGDGDRRDGLRRARRRARATT